MVSCLLISSPVEDSLGDHLAVVLSHPLLAQPRQEVPGTQPLRLLHSRFPLCWKVSTSTRSPHTNTTLIAFFSLSSPIIVSWMASNIGGQTKKALSMSLFNAGASSDHPLLLSAISSPPFLHSLQPLPSEILLALFFLPFVPLSAFCFSRAAVEFRSLTEISSFRRPTKPPSTTRVSAPSSVSSSPAPEPPASSSLPSSLPTSERRSSESPSASRPRSRTCRWSPSTRPTTTERWTVRPRT